MYQVNVIELQDLIRKRIYPSKVPLMVYGSYGIGKSRIKKDLAKVFASIEGKQFVAWHEASKADKVKMIKNPGDYFVFTDQRIAQMDTTDLRGIPNMVAGTEWLETMPLSWIIYITQPEAKGLVFFDEINLAAPLVSAQAYQIVCERVVADRALSPHIQILAAGNRMDDQAHVYKMPGPMRDRFAEVELIPDVESWSKWAYGNINPHLIAFVNWKHSWLHRVDKKSDQKATTPRGIERASLLIGDLDITSNEVNMLVSISVGEGFANEFQGYCKCYAELDWDALYKDPERAKKMTVDKLWTVTGGMLEQYIKDQDQKTRQLLFNKQIKVVQAMPQDFTVVCLRMFKDYDFDLFRACIKKCGDYQHIATTFGKFVLD